MLEKLQPLLLKLLPFETLIILGGFVLLLVLLAAALIRQRRMGQIINVVTANFANMRTKLEDAVNKQKVQLDDGLGSVRKQLQQIVDNQQRDATETGDMRRRVDELANGIRDAVYQIQESVSASGQNDAAARP
jgi:cobalamin biosynthesis protein CobD/CbiB